MESSQALERNVLEAVDLRVVVHLHVVFGLRILVRVFEGAAYAAAAVERGDESVQATADGTSATQTGNIGHAGDRSTVLALGGIRVERHHAATTCKERIMVNLFQILGGGGRNIIIISAMHRKCGGGRHPRPTGTGSKLTAFEIALGVDTFPRAWAAAVDTAHRPAAALLHARAAAEPAPCDLRLLRGTRALGLAHAVADLFRRLAFALLGTDRRARGESVRALEPAGVPVDTGGNAVVRVVAVSWGRVDDLWI